MVFLNNQENKAGKFSSCNRGLKVTKAAQILTIKKVLIVKRKEKITFNKIYHFITYERRHDFITFFCPEHWKISL